MDDYTAGFYMACRLFGAFSVVAIIVVMIVAVIYELSHPDEETVREMEMLAASQSKETHEKMEVIAVHPSDRDKMCPFCGALYPCSKFRCDYDGYDLVERPKRITEPLPVITDDITELKADLQRQLGLMPAQEPEIPDDIKEVWEELELTAEYYNCGKRCRFTCEEVLKLCALETKWNSTKQQERRAS